MGAESASARRRYWPSRSAITLPTTSLALLLGIPRPDLGEGAALGDQTAALGVGR